MTAKLKSIAALAAISVAFATSASAAVLTGKNGMTVYIFDKDVGGKPTCYQACAKMWPPYLAKKGEKPGKGWSEVKRTDGELQWAYDGKPVYFYAPDKKKGDKKGDGVEGIWHLVNEFVTHPLDQAHASAS